MLVCVSVSCNHKWYLSIGQDPHNMRLCFVAAKQKSKLHSSRRLNMSLKKSQEMSVQAGKLLTSMGQSKVWKSLEPLGVVQSIDWWSKPAYKYTTRHIWYLCIWHVGGLLFGYDYDCTVKADRDHSAKQTTHSRSGEVSSKVKQTTPVGCIKMNFFS
jgi:hypothetical protein